MAYSIHPEDTIDYEAVIKKTFGKLKDLMAPDPIIDYDTEETIFEIKDKSDIKNKMTTTEKNETILTNVRSQGENGYRTFKGLLNRTQQEELVEFLTCTENGLDTREIEKNLYIKAEKSLNLSQNYFQHKRELKKSLIRYYRNKRSTVPLSPLVEELETNLAGFYVMPDMVFVEQTSPTNHYEERIPVESLTDMFNTGSEDQREIYLSADAGIGKTSFSKYLAITWCQACCPDKDQYCFKEGELKALANFEFLFLILLRDAEFVCYIDKMIEHQIINKITRSASQCPLQDILNREKCLIILDGLDEWAHPVNDCDRIKEKIPHRYVRDNCVIITTTRPWKLVVSNLNSSQINKKIELVQLSQDSMRQLEKNAIRKMSDVKDDVELEKQAQAFNKVINERGFKHMQTIPLLLIYLTCLWCNKIPIGNSKVEVYINIIEFLLSRTTQKHPEVHPYTETSQSDILEIFKKTICQEVNCQEPTRERHTHRFCQKFYSLLTALAKLAYHTLFNEKRENTLVFDESVAEKHLKADEMKLSLLSGILTGSTITTLIERTTKVCFSHKSVQEFFAAIYICSQSDGHKLVLEKCKAIQSIFQMSTICQFISSINGKMMREISNGIMPVINENENTCIYRTRTGWEMLEENPLYHIQNMLLSCLKEMPKGENIKLCLQDLFLSRQNEQDLIQLSETNTINIKSLYICICSTSNSERGVFELSSLTHLNNLQKLYCEVDRESVKDVEIMINDLLSPSIKSLRLTGKRTNYERNLSDNIEQMRYLQYLNISDFNFSHDMLEKFIKFLSSKKELKDLTLSRLYCNNHERRNCDSWLDFDLSKHSQLTKLALELLPPLKLNIQTPSLVDVCLSDINLGESSLLLSPEMVNIKRVELKHIEMAADSLQNNVEVLNKLPQSVTVNVEECRIEGFNFEFRNICCDTKQRVPVVEFCSRNKKIKM